MEMHINPPVDVEGGDVGHDEVGEEDEDVE